MNGDLLGWLAAGALGLGVWLLLNALSGVLLEFVTLRLRTTGAATQRVEDALGDPERLPWSRYYLLAAALMLVVLQTLWGSSAQLAAPLILAIPWFAQRYLRGAFRRSIENESRLLLVNLRMELSAGGTLLPALQAVAERNDPPRLSAVLRRALAGYQGSGMDVVRLLAQRTQSRWLTDMVSRLDAAQDGLLSTDEALTQSLTRMSSEMDTQVREQLQNLPNRLIFQSVPLILGPVLAGTLLPLAMRIIGIINGGGLAGGY